MDALVMVQEDEDLKPNIPNVRLPVKTHFYAPPFHLLMISESPLAASLFSLK